MPSQEATDFQNGFGTLDAIVSEYQNSYKQTGARSKKLPMGQSDELGRVQYIYRYGDCGCNHWNLTDLANLV